MRIVLIHALREEIDQYPALTLELILTETSLPVRTCKFESQAKQQIDN